MPKQEKGIKPSCALPYQLYADGSLSADKKSFNMKFTAGDEVFGKSASGAPFNVYAPGKYLQEKDNMQVMDDVRTWAYTAIAGDTITDKWPLNEFENAHYHLRIYGPNGFYREYKGNAADPAIEITCAYQHSLTDSKKISGNIELMLDNGSDKDHVIEITDHAYHNKPIKHLLKNSTKGIGLVIDLSKSHNWYDFSVKISGNNTFEKRYAGRVETGRPGYTDPQMGGV
jgi:phospholipase C